MAQGSRQSPHPNRRRPPSYPAVVTTTASNGGGAGHGENNAAPTPTPTPTPTTAFSSGKNDITTAPLPLSLESALRLYERDGNASASLDACQRLWKTDGDHAHGQNAPKMDSVGKNKVESENNDSVPLSRQHNQAVLEHLSSLQSQHRRVRPRPPSFDEGVVTEGSDPKERVENLAVTLSSMLTVSSISNAPESEQRGGTAVNAKQKEKRKNKEHQKQQHSGEKNADGNNGDQLLGDYNHLVGMYNVCLANYSSGNYQEALNIILSPFVNAMKYDKVYAEGVSVNEGEVNADNEKHSLNCLIGHLVMMTRIAFLVLDCQISLHAGNGMGLGSIVADVQIEPASNDYGIHKVTIAMEVEEILSWIENNALAFSSKVDNNVTDLEQYESIKPDELKFRLHLYRSRMLFVGNQDSSEGGGRVNDLESRTRISRKELKNAMDIYQNKLCIAEEGKEHGKKGKHSKHGGSKGGSGGTEGGSAQLQASAKGKSHQDVSDTTSVTSMAGGSLVTSVSDALWSEGKGGVGAARATFEGMPNKNVAQQQQQQTSQPLNAPSKVKVKKDTPNRQVRHESVLYLKANLEHLRGNTTKSLKLCAEARSAGKKSRTDRHGETENGRGDSRSRELKEIESPHNVASEDKAHSSDLDDETQMASDYDEAIYYNNLALLHQSAGKIHLALHYYSFALSYMARVKSHGEDSPTTGRHHHLSNQNFWSDGMARPDISAEILHNTSICAFQAQEFDKAYECMAQCVKISPTVFGKRARCWLRLAQSCIGMNATSEMITQSNDATSVMGLDSNDLCSEEDLCSIPRNPLQRASFCLFRALHLSSGNPEINQDIVNAQQDGVPSLKEGSADVDTDCFEMALVSLVHVKLQLKDTELGSLELCKQSLLAGSENGRNGVVSYTYKSQQLRKMAEMFSREKAALSSGHGNL